MRFAYSLLPLVFLALSCKSVPQSDLKHDADQFTREKSPFQWVSLPRDRAFERMLLPLNDGYPEDQPTVRRLQFWVDQIDSIVKRDLVKGLGEVIPKPKIAILNQTKFNGYAGATTFQVPKRVVFGLSAANATVSPIPYFIVRYNRSRDQILAGPLPGPVAHDNLPFKPAEILSWVRWQLSPRASQQCNLSQVIESDELILIPPGCANAAELAKIGPYKQPFEVYAMIDWIFLTHGLLENMSEGQAIASAAHELSHYYRAHSIVPDRDKLYDYKLGDKNPSSLPTRTPQGEKNNELATKAELNNWDKEPDWPITSVQGYKDNMLIVTIDFGVAGYKAQFGELSNTCPDYAKAATQMARLGRKMAPVPPRLRQDCFEKVTLGSKAGREVTQFWRSRTSSDNFDIRDLPSASETMTLNIWLDKMAEALRDFRLKIRDALDSEPATGYYTHEQEADEMAVEILAKMGFDPDLMAQAVLKLSEQLDSPDYVRTCKEQRKNKWIDPKTAKPYEVDMGPKTNLHHRNCFRIRNLDRDIEAHQWKQGSVKPVADLLPPSEWNVLKGRLDAL
ncbi:MAG: hypothetical protein NTZ90_09470 [Proteobacteria bacterium]|nr:hypothetical protein [Pseudomonadota bacterium]